MSFNERKANAIVADGHTGLSSPSKPGCRGYSLPTWSCPRGLKLSDKPGTT